MGEQDDMAMVHSAHLKVLQQWYPNDIQKPNNWIHKRCLASLGLFPLPDGDIPLANVIGEKVTNRIKEIANQHTSIKAPRELIRQISEQLLQEFSVPMENGQEQLRWMISHWVTMNLSAGRGGASAKDDIGDVVWEGALVQVDLSNGLFTGVVEKPQTTENPAPVVGIPDIALMSTMPTEQIVAMTACLNSYINAVQMQSQAYSKKCEHDLNLLNEKAEVEAWSLKAKAEVEERSHKLEVQSLKEKADCEIRVNESKRKIIETEIELHKIRQQGECATAMVEHPKKRKCTQDKLPTLLRSGHDSIGAAMLNQVVNREPLSAEEVVHQWLDNASLSESAIEVSDGQTEQDSVGPTATSSCSLLRPPLSTNIRQAISCEQQEQDIRRLCQVTSVSYEEWPAKPIHDEPPSADVMRRWNAMSEDKKWKVHQLVQSMGWTSPFNSYLLVALGTKLDRWDWVTGNNGYPKSS